MDQTGRNGQTEKLKALFSAPVLKRSVTLNGHRTSVSLEEPFWIEIKSIAETEKVSLNALISKVDEVRGAISLSSALRLYILHRLRK